ncbi:MAG: cyclic nucleotide-binding domain-containing protein [Vulcanimicrobiota bacterium]
MLSTLEKILFIQQISLFKNLSASELSILAQKAAEVGFSKGQTVFRQGEPGDSLYIILGGKVRVIKELEKERKTVAILEEKNCFGEMAILSDEEERTATIEAADTLTLLKIKKADFHELILQEPEMAFEIFDILIDRLRDATEMSVKQTAGPKANE